MVGGVQASVITKAQQIALQASTESDLTLYVSDDAIREVSADGLEDLGYDNYAAYLRQYLPQGNIPYVRLDVDQYLAFWRDVAEGPLNVEWQ